MPRTLPLVLICALSICVAGLFVASAAQEQKQPASAGAQPVAPGALEVVGTDGAPKGVACPLKHTSVRAEISGFVARVTVAQEFENPFEDKIEAVYTFPLSQNAAVDRMTMKVGDRTVAGRVLRREQARAVYEAARERGQVASLLDEERPNIFTQSVANIEPGARVSVEISYVEKLKYEAGTYEFSFPMVVGPRYVPGAATGRQGGGFAPDTTRVPDASRITPAPAPAGTRAGHDIDLTVALDAGLPVGEIRSTSHEIAVERAGERGATIKLKDAATIPNKDFVLRYDAAGGQIGDGLLAHRDGRGGYFTLILQPPASVEPADATPKEIVFVLDTSGSMSGFPIEKAKEAMWYALRGLNPQDTFNLITFSGDTRVLFPQPVAPTPENVAKAEELLNSTRGYGGTEMMKAIRAALDASDSQAHVRVVCFMTDGYVGNDMEIVSEIQKHPNARVFSFGIGSSVNRFLLDKMAEQGRGEVEYVSLNDDGSAAARRFYERVRSPLLTDITLEWEGVAVDDVYPKRVPDLFSAKPVVVTGRYLAGGRGVVHLRGRVRGKDFARDIAVEFPESEPRHDALASLWARARVDDLMNQDMMGAQRGSMRDDLKQTITQLGLEYGLMTQFTSFVAVEEMTITEGGQPRRVEVPVEMPEGVSREGVFGGGDQPFARLQILANLSASPQVITRAGGAGGGGNDQASYGAAETVTVVSSSDEALETSSATLGRVFTQEELARMNGDSSSSGRARDKDAKKDAKAAQREEKARREAEESARLRSKCDARVFNLIARLKDNASKPSGDESKFVRDGKAEIQVWLVEKTPEALAELKKLGFEVSLDPQTAKLVIGRVAIDKLAALVELKQVRFVAAQAAD